MSSARQDEFPARPAGGNMVFPMLVMLGELAHDLVSERTAAALAHKRYRGKRAGDIASQHAAEL